MIEKKIEVLSEASERRLAKSESASVKRQIRLPIIWWPSLIKAQTMGALFEALSYEKLSSTNNRCEETVTDPYFV